MLRSRHSATHRVEHRPPETLQANNQLVRSSKGEKDHPREGPLTHRNQQRAREGRAIDRILVGHSLPEGTRIRTLRGGVTRESRDNRREGEEAKDVAHGGGHLVHAGGRTEHSVVPRRPL